MTYKGYSARIEFDSDDGLFVGHLAGVNDIIGFHAETVSDLRHAFQDSVDDYLETCGKVGKAPDRPFSGKVMFRLAPEVHAHAALAAELSGQSLNQWAEEALRKASARDLQHLRPE